jgi:prepilin-type N-terminal cleavage/methylation domain-containing protein
MEFKKGFTLIELLVVIAIISLLSAISYSIISSSREKAIYARAESEFKTIYSALELYKLDNFGNYPADAERGMPSGLEAYIANGVWPEGPWPQSQYDWDNWPNPQNPTERIYQISVRFCPAGGNISQCQFPNTSWASSFGVNSALYYCLEGSCRAHYNEVISYPARCANCNNN